MKRMKDVGWLLVLALGTACSAGSDSDTASQTGEVAESEGGEPTEPSADTDEPSGDEASAEGDTGEPTEPSTATDTSEPEAATSPAGQATESETSPESTASAPELVQDCSAPNVECPPPPLDWCDSGRDIPIEDWLAEHWNSFCDDAASPDAGAGDDDSAPTGSDPANADAIACGIAIGGPGASPCPPPPLDWCGANHDPFPLPDLVAYWDSTCGGAGSLP